MRLLHAILFLFVCGPLLAQGEIDIQEKIFWRNERSGGLLLNSDGWSVLYRELRQTQPTQRWFLEGGLGTFKHPKEIKLSNYVFQGPGTFVFGKLNSVWTLTAGGGFHQELFEKRDLGGVSISWFAGGGVAVLFATPIYYKVINYSFDGYYFLTEEKFNIDSIHQALDIYSKASFFKGFNEMKVYPGFYARGGFSFEYSHNDKLTHSIELGASIHGYSKKIPIMATESNKQFFPAFFVSYRAGFILDPLKPGKFFPFLARPREE